MLYFDGVRRVNTLLDCSLIDRLPCLLRETVELASLLIVGSHHTTTSVDNI